MADEFFKLFYTAIEGLELNLSLSIEKKAETTDMSIIICENDKEVVRVEHGQLSKTLFAVAFIELEKWLMNEYGGY